MQLLTRNFSYIRNLPFSIRQLSTEVEKDSLQEKPNPSQKPALRNKEPIFYKRRAQLNADIKGNRFSFQYQTSAKINYDLWQFVVDFIETFFHINKLKEERAKVSELKHKLEAEKKLTNQIEKELEQLRRSLLRNYREASKEMSQNVSNEALQFLKNELDMEIEGEKWLSKSHKMALIREQIIYEEFTAAVDSSFEQEKLHFRFLKSTIFVGIFATFILTALIFYIYNFHLSREVRIKTLQINELIEQSCAPQLKNQVSWSSSINGYVRPLYSWALPKK